MEVLKVTGTEFDGWAAEQSRDGTYVFNHIVGDLADKQEVPFHLSCDRSFQQLSGIAVTLKTASNGR